MSRGLCSSCRRVPGDKTGLVFGFKAVDLVFPADYLELFASPSGVGFGRHGGAREIRVMDVSDYSSNAVFEDVLTVRDAAEFLSVPTHALRSCPDKGLIECSKRGRTRLFSYEQLN